MSALHQDLWSAQQIADAVGGTLAGNKDWRANGVSLDSRKIGLEDLFVALKGPNFNGHNYIAMALNSGASACLASERPEGLPDDAPLVMVEDTEKALWKLAEVARARFSGKIIGVTGSVGKTGTKEALKHVLAQQGATYATFGNLNNHFGVPLTLSRMPANRDFAVIEMGMNHAGEIEPLSELTQPDIAIITTVEPVHIEFFNSVEEIADAKSEIFAGVKQGGTAILNRDNPHFERMQAKAQEKGLKIVSFGARAEADSRLLSCELTPNSTKVKAIIAGQELDFAIGIPGRHHALNALAVLTAVAESGADLTEAANALASLSPVKGRGERRLVPLRNNGEKGRAFTLIDESYNASPIAMRAAFNVLKGSLPGAEGRRIAILGDMLELGDKADQYHQELAKDLVGGNKALVFACGPHMKQLYESLPNDMQAGYAPDSKLLAPMVQQAICPGDIVMVKGSLGSRMKLVVDALIDLSKPAQTEPTHAV